MKLLKIAILSLSFVFVTISNSFSDITGVIIPAYTNPTFGDNSVDDAATMWASLVNTAEDPNRNFSMRVVINPLDGPGASNQRERLRNQYFGTDGSGPAGRVGNASRSEILGYVFTSNGQRAAQDIINDVDAYFQGPYQGRFDGIFFDEYAVAPEAISNMQQVFNHISSNYSDRVFVGNPGAVGTFNEMTSAQARAFLDPLDTLVSHENTRAAYENDYTRFNKTDEYDESKFGHLVHSFGSSWDESILDLANSRRADWLYVTSDAGSETPDPNHWNNFDANLWTDFTGSLSDSISAVPEPRSFGFLLLLGSFCLAGRQKK